jgi:hypothetical protein
VSAIALPESASRAPTPNKRPAASVPTAPATSSTTTSGRKTGGDPLEVARIFEERADVPRLDFGLPKEGHRTGSELRGHDRRRLVFIGGNYGKCIDRIYAAREAVDDGGYVPVVARELQALPGQSERLKSFRLRDACETAVFEGSEAGGWVPELERLAASQPLAPTLLVFVGDTPAKRHPSAMLPGPSEMPAMRLEPYATHHELRYKVLRWLVQDLPQR